MDEDEDEDEDDEEEGEEEEEEEEEGAEEDEVKQKYNFLCFLNCSLMTSLALPLQEIDPSAILGRRTRGNRVDYTSEAALKKAGLKDDEDMDEDTH